MIYTKTQTEIMSAVSSYKYVTCFMARQTGKTTLAVDLAMASSVDTKVLLLTLRPAYIEDSYGLVRLENIDLTIDKDAEYGLIIVDEPDFLSSKVTRQLEKLLDGHTGRVLMLGTPGLNKSIFSEFYTRGLQGEPGYYSIRADYRQSPNKGYISRVEAGEFQGCPDELYPRQRWAHPC